MKNGKKFFPYIVAFLLFVVVPALYFAPQFEGMDLRKFDSVQANGAYSAVLDHIDKYDEHPWWIANMFGGMPSYPIHTESSPDLVKSASGYLYFLGDPAAYYFMMMGGFFLMLVLFGVNPWLAIPGALAYGLSTYFIILFEAGHIMKIIALAYVAPLIGALYYTYRKSFWIGAPLFGMFTLLEISSVHPQITYYFILAMLIMVICIGIYSYKQKELRRFWIASGFLILTTALAVGANSIYLYYTYDYSKDSTRGPAILTSENGVKGDGGLDKDYITAWSYGKMETFNIFIPNLMGGKSGGGFSTDGEVGKTLQKYTNKREAEAISQQLPGYWGPQPMTSGPVYIGAVMIFLFVLGLFIIRGINLWWIVGASALSLLLAWGRHFMGLTDLFIDYFPLYNKFRTVSMILVVVELTVPLMAMLALKQIWDRTVEPQRLKKALINSLYITGGVALFFILLGGAIFSFSSPTDGSLGLPEEIVAAMRSERADMLRLDAFRSLVFVALTFGVVWLWVKHKVSKGIFIAVLSVLVLADMVPVGLRHVNHEMFNEPKGEASATPMTEVDKEILKDPDINYRVANLAVPTFSDATTSIYHRSIGGYFPAQPRRYKDVIDHYLSKMYMPVYNMLNTKYFIVRDDKGTLGLRVNPDAFGNAWIVSSVKEVATPNEEFAAVGEVNLRETAVVMNEFSGLLKEVSFEPIAGDTVVHTMYKANRLEYKSSLSAPRLVLFSEVYYPKGWKAYIDDVEVPYLRADYLLNALVVPAGEHTIVFEFIPPHLALMRTIAIGSSALLVLLLVLGIIINALKKRNKNVL